MPKTETMTLEAALQEVLWQAEMFEEGEGEPDLKDFPRIAQALRIVMDAVKASPLTPDQRKVLEMLRYESVECRRGGSTGKSFDFYNSRVDAITAALNAPGFTLNELSNLRACVDEASENYQFQEKLAAKLDVMIAGMDDNADD